MHGKPYVMHGQVVVSTRVLHLRNCQSNEPLWKTGGPSAEAESEQACSFGVDTEVGAAEVVGQRCGNGQPWTSSCDVSFRSS
jgi:hypothetical protein